MILQKEDIIKFVQENEQDKEQRRIKKQQIDKERSDCKKGAFNRHDCYKDFLLDNCEDGFIVEYPHGTVIRQAETKWYFRGERTCYQSSQPTFIRSLNQKSEEEKFLLDFVKNAKLLEFERILNLFNHYGEFKNIGINFPGGKQTSLSGLFVCIAQHYGLDTNWLDITGDFNAALFFACCKYENGKWRSLTDEDIEENPYGRVFRRPSFLGIGGKDYEVYPIGFQPFMRCHMQHGYGIWMEEAMDLTKKESVFKILKFEHSVGLSEYIFEKMDRGERIYPQEGLKIIEDELEELRNTKKIPEFILNKTYELTDFKLKYSVNSLKELLNKYGYTITSEPLKIAEEKIEKINQNYEGFDIEKTYGIKLSTRLIYRNH